MIAKGEIHVFLRGGLGNQLFQYATGLAYSIENQSKLVIRPDLLPEVEDKISGVSRWPNQISSFEHSGELRNYRPQPTNSTNAFGKSMQMMRMLGDLSPSITEKLGWLTGENSNHKPFSSRGIRVVNSYSANKVLAWGIRERLADEIGRVVAPSPRFEALKSEMIAKRPIVAHLRQGDYLNLKGTYGELSASYFQGAVKILRGSQEDGPIWLFTDGSKGLSPHLLEALEPCRVIGPNEPLSPLETLSLMSTGGSFIASNSSFSWWAAFLQAPSNMAVVPNVIDAKVNNFTRGAEPDVSLEFLDV